MYKLGDKEYSEQEIGNAFWKCVKTRMELCKKIATECLNNMHRVTFYRIDYRVDPGIETVYADFTDNEYNFIKNEIEEYIAEIGGFKDFDERVDFIREEAKKWNINWRYYIPDHDWYWAGGEPEIYDVDLDDFKLFCKFIVSYIMGGDAEKKYKNTTNIELDDEEYITLLSLRLFDPSLCFSDLSYLLPDLFKRIDDVVHNAHCDHFIVMKEINEVAKNLMETNEDYRGLPDLKGNIFSPIIINEILVHKKKYNDDDFLFKAFNLFVSSRP